jgi:hypothetical protein
MAPYTYTAIAQRCCSPGSTEATKYVRRLNAPIYLPPAPNLVDASFLLNYIN